NPAKVSEEDVAAANVASLHLLTIKCLKEDLIRELEQTVKVCTVSSSGEPSPPAVHGQRGMGKAYRLGLVKQDDGGMPIVEYIIKYKTVSKKLCVLPLSPSYSDKEEQWMTKLVPGANDFAMLQPLQWNTRYEVEITARNVKGLSEPTFYQFFMPQKPDITGKNTIKVNIVLQFTFLFHMAAEGFLEVLKLLLDFFMWNAVIFLSW
ncbi:hypothetical protein XENOCAPTIV_027760, partial [Xenoophorus captivus]